MRLPSPLYDYTTRARIRVYDCSAASYEMYDNDDCDCDHSHGSHAKGAPATMPTTTTATTTTATFTAAFRFHHRSFRQPDQLGLSARFHSATFRYCWRILGLRLT